MAPLFGVVLADLDGQNCDFASAWPSFASASPKICQYCSHCEPEMYLSEEIFYDSLGIASVHACCNTIT